jgi:hypothetical protein
MGLLYLYQRIRIEFLSHWFNVKEYTALIQGLILSDNYLLSLPSAIEPRVFYFGCVGDVNAKTEPIGNDNRQLLDKRIILHSI